MSARQQQRYPRLLHQPRGYAQLSYNHFWRYRDMGTLLGTVQEIDNHSMLTTINKNIFLWRYIEEDILQLMAFLGEEVDGDLTTQKIRGESSSLSGYTSTAAIYVHANLQSQYGRHERTGTVLCILRLPRHWAQDSKQIKDIAE